MSEFKPSTPIPFGRIISIFCTLLVLAGVMQSINMLYATAVYTVAELIAYLYKRYVHIFNHRRLKSYGLSVAWIQFKHLHDKLTCHDFLDIWETCLCNRLWRTQFITILSTADFICTYDTLEAPFKLRWSLKLKFVEGWTDNEKLAASITLVTGLPDSQPWRIASDDTSVTIETYMYKIESPVLEVDDSPQEALDFWYTFNNDLVWLLDANWFFKEPIFKQGIVEYIFFELPAKFSLSGGSYLTVTEFESKLKVESFDMQHNQGETMFYADEREFWSVWRYAIQHTIFELDH